MMHFLVANAGEGYAVVNTTATAEVMTLSNLWTEVPISTWLARRYALERVLKTHLRFFIRADGRFATACEEEQVNSLLDQDFYEVDADDYDLFVKRHGLMKQKPVMFDLPDLNESED